MEVIRNLTEAPGGPKNDIVVLAGAGMSTNLGIASFRGKDGIFATLAKKYPELGDPRDIFSSPKFIRSPTHRKAFYEFSQHMLQQVSKSAGTDAHFFVKLLQNKGVLRRLYTQVCAM